MKMIGLVAAATLSLAAMPAFAAGQVNVLEQAIACDLGYDTFDAFGGFSRLVSIHGGWAWSGGFASINPDPKDIANPLAGFSVRPTKAIPFKSWSMDVSSPSNVQNAPYTVTAFQVPTGFITFWNSTNPHQTNVSNFTSTPLSNGSQRWRFTGVPSNAVQCRPQTTPLSTANAKLSAIFFMQYASDVTGETSSDLVTNVLVNGVHPTPVVNHPYQYDCSGDDSCDDTPVAL